MLPSQRVTCEDPRMPRAAKKKPPVGAPTSRALEHGDRAAGAAYIKPGFCFDERDDLAFALGFPYLKYLSDDVVDPVAEAERLARDDYPHQQSTYPRGAALRLLRAEFTPGAPPTEPIEADEAAAMIADRVEKDPRPFGEMRYFLIEAFVGPDAVAAGLLRGLRNMPTARWVSHASLSRFGLDALCILSLRLAPEARDGVMSELRELRARVLAEARAGFDPAAAKSELLISPEQKLGYLYGENPEGYKAELRRRRALQDRIDFVTRDGADAGFDAVVGMEIIAPPRPILNASAENVRRARVADAAESWYTIPDPRAVFVGGEEVYRVELSRWSAPTPPTPPGSAHRIILDRFGRIRSPLSVELALDMSLRSKAKTDARTWLSIHAEYARPILGQIAGGSSRLAKDAAAAIADLPS